MEEHNIHHVTEVAKWIAVRLCITALIVTFMICYTMLIKDCRSAEITVPVQSENLRKTFPQLNSYKIIERKK